MHVGLPRAGLIARVEARGSDELAHAQVEAATLLAQRSAPAARLFRPKIQPIFVDGVAVSLWHGLDPAEDAGFGPLGRTVRAFHEATRLGLPPETRAIDPFGRIRVDLDWPSAWSASAASRELALRSASLEAKWSATVLEDPLGTVLVHGDVHTDNVMAGEDGLVLIDLEDAGVGPASWDFAPLAVAVRRYGLPAEHYRHYVAGYCADPGEWPGLDLMCQVYELLVTAWAMRCGAESPSIAAEAAIRVDALLNGGERPWTLV